MLNLVIIKNLVVILTLFPVFQAQVSKIDAWETDLKRFELNYIESTQQTRVLSQKVDSLAQVIESQKKGAEGFLGERTLEKLLAHSQKVAGDLSMAKQQSRIQLELLSTKATMLLDSLNNLNAELTRALVNIPQDQRIQSSEKLMTDLRRVRQLMVRCRRHTPSRLLYDGLMSVVVDSSDTRESIQQKADFLLDQADRLSRQATDMAKNVGSLKNELEMRNRIGDFFSDLALTDPSMEVASTDQQNLASGISQNDIESATFDGGDDSRNIGFDERTQSVVIAEQPFSLNELENVGSNDIEKWITSFEKQQKQWLFQADSLKNRAQVFHNLLKGRDE